MRRIWSSSRLLAPAIAVPALLFGVAAPAITPGAGWTVKSFATSFAVDSGTACCGPIGIAFAATGKVFVADPADGHVYRFAPTPPSGGWVADAKHRLDTTALTTPAGLTFGTDGRLYATLRDLGQVVEISSTNGAILRVVATGLDCPTQLATDPLSGDLFTGPTCGHDGPITRIADPEGTPSPSAYTATFTQPDGFAIAPDGTFYVETAGSIDTVDGTTSPTAGAAHPLTGPIAGAVGVAVAANRAQPSSPPFLAVNGTDGSITQVDLPSLAQAPIATAGSRGDIVAVGPDGCLYATQSSSVIEVTKADGSCPFAPTGHQPPAPASAAPALGQAAPAKTVTVLGAGFAAGAAVSIAGAGITTSSVAFKSATKLTLKVAVSAAAAPGPHDVTVTNLDGESGTCLGCFTVDPAPHPTSTSPSSAPPGSTLDVHVLGTDFQPGAHVSFGDGVTVNSVVFVSSTDLRTNVTIAPSAALGFRNVGVVNATDAGRSSCIDCFRVT